MALHLWEAKGRPPLFRRFHLPEQSRPHLRGAGRNPSGSPVPIRKPCPSVKKSWASIRKRPSRSDNCGAALAGDAQWEKAAQTLEEALSCYESLGLSDSPEAVTCRNNLNLCRNAVKQSAAQ